MQARTKTKKGRPALEQPFLRKKLREMCFMAVSGYGKDCFDTALFRDNCKMIH